MNDQYIQTTRFSISFVAQPQPLTTLQNHTQPQQTTHTGVQRAHI